MSLATDGTYAAISYKHVLYLPIAVVQSGGFFGIFLACGTVIRCEETGEVRALRDASTDRLLAHSSEEATVAAAARSTLSSRPRAQLLAATAPPPPRAARSALIAAIVAD